MAQMRVGHEDRRKRKTDMPEFYPGSTDRITDHLYENGNCPYCGNDMQWRLHRVAAIECSVCHRIIHFNGREKAH